MDNRLMGDSSFQVPPPGTPVLIRTADGRNLGYFTITKLPPEAYAPRISEEEMERRLTDPNGTWYTAEEVEAKMKEWRCSR